MDTITSQPRVARYRRYHWIAGIAIALRLLAETEGQACAQAAAPASDGVSGHRHTLPWDPLTQKWDALQKPLENRGIDLDIRYDGEIFTNFGGLRQGATYLGNFNLQLKLDAEHLLGWRGATVFLYGLGIHGGNPSGFVGDEQGVTNIEAPAKWTFEEAWIE